MIFVTVGTHEQPFNRLVECINDLKKNGLLQEEIIIQTGYSTYEPKYCIWQRFYAYQEMVKYIAEARVIITHGGPSSFIMPLQMGKIPIVIPRKYDFNEHVNNHQVVFSNVIAQRMGNIIVVEDTEKLIDVINRYDEIVNDMRIGLRSNNTKFNEDLSLIVDTMFK